MKILKKILAWIVLSPLIAVGIAIAIPLLVILFILELFNWAWYVAEGSEHKWNMFRVLE
jgi:phosphate/sulfate permease